MVSDWVEEKEAAATKDSTTVPTGCGAALGRQVGGRTAITMNPGQVHKEGGGAGHGLPVEGQAVGGFVDLPVLFLHLRQLRAGPKPKIWMSFRP